MYSKHIKCYKLILICIIFKWIAIYHITKISNALEITSSQKSTKNETIEWECIDDSPYVVFKDSIYWDENKITQIPESNISTGNWQPARIRNFNHKNVNKFCFDDLTEIQFGAKYLCIRVSKKMHKFEEQFCYGTDIFDPNNLKKDEYWAFIKYLKEYQINKFWLPMQRNENSFNGFFIKLPGKYWGDKFEVQFSSNQFFSNKNCLAAVLVNNNLEFELVHCSNSMHSICVFKVEPLTSVGCSTNFYAQNYLPTQCFGQSKFKSFSSEYIHLSFTDYFNHYNLLMMVLSKFDSNQYFVAYSFVSVNGEKLYVQVNKKKKCRIVIERENDSAYLSKQILKKNKVEMTLKESTGEKWLVLTIYNKKYIWTIGNDEKYGVKCFTDNKKVNRESLKIKQFWATDDESKTMFSIKIEENIDGYYWCEAHTIYNFELLATEKILIRRSKNIHIFSTTLNVPIKLNVKFTSESLYKQLEHNLKYIMKDAQRQMQDINSLIIENVRIKSILNITINNTEIVCLTHITTSCKDAEGEKSNELSSESVENSIELNYESVKRKKVHYMIVKLLSKICTCAFYVRSTEFCFSEIVKSKYGEEILWNEATIGNIATTRQLCLMKNGLPMSRKCIGDFQYGAFWEKSLPEVKCSDGVNKKHITKQLYNFYTSNLYKKDQKKTLNTLVNLLENNIEKLISADFYYIAKIIESSTKYLNFTTTDDTAGKIIKIFNYLLQVGENIIKPSVQLNSTNVLLFAFERIIDKISLTENFRIDNTPQITSNSLIHFRPNVPNQNVIGDAQMIIKTIEYDDIGVVVKIASNVIIFVIDPSIANVTGVALLDNARRSFEKETSAESNEDFRFILSNQTIDDLLNENDIDLATYIPYTLLLRLDEISKQSNQSFINKLQSPRFVIKIYSNDVLFQENENKYMRKAVLGKVISLTIPGHDTELPEMLPLIFKLPPTIPLRTKNYNCSYWNYKTWANDGVQYLGKSNTSNTLVLCGCTHLTPFAFLIGTNFKIPDYEIDKIVEIFDHKKALDYITMVGCSLSIFGVFGIILTAVVFESWRRKASSKVLLNLSVAILFQMSLICFINTEKFSQHLIDNKYLSSCVALGASLYYFVLVQFSWMIIIAYLQFKRYVKVLGNIRPKRFFIKSFFLGWGTPFVPVTFVILFDHNSFTKGTICYPSGFSLYIGVIVPIIAVILTNLVIFFLVLFYVLRGPTESLRHTDKRHIISQLRLFVLLFFLLGFTWIFGLFSIIQNEIIFSYLFCFTATLQGFVLFLYFIVLDPFTRRMWRNCFQSKCCTRKYDHDFSTSMKEATQSIT